jgi:subtilisin family serine protease
MRVLGTFLTAAAVVVTGSAVPAQAAQGRVVGAGAPGAVPGRYIVTLKHPRTSGPGITAQALGGTSYTATMTATQARQLAADPNVGMVEQDRILHVESTQRNPDWGLDRIDQRAVTPSKTYTPTDDGSSVHAYVIDTGIRITHSEFAGRASYGYDFVDGDTSASDCNGHGTHVAGTIGGTHYGVAKKVQLVAVRVLDCEGSGYLSDVIAGINWVTTHAVKPAVANMSLGGGKSPSLEAAVAKSINAGVTYVLAAGNEDTNAANTSPAGLAAAITVGATDSRDRRASFSNYGSVLDLFAPGVNIRSSVADSDTATASYSGTSMASPHVAGAAALVLDATPAYTPAQVRNFLVAKATAGKVTDPKGSPNRLLFVPAPPAAPVIASTGIWVTAGTAYSSQLKLTASRRGTWSVAAGSLPEGLTLWPSGTITGTPTGPGTDTVTVRFVDYVPYTVTRQLKVVVAASDPEIATESLPDGETGADYSEQLALADGRGATWSLTAGDLPAGLTLSEDGLISGVPEEAGTAEFTVAVTDGWGGTAARDFTLTVA